MTEQKEVVIGGGKGATIGNLLGLGAGLYYAHKKGMGIGGYIGYGFLFGIGGWIVGGVGDTLLEKSKTSTTKS